MAVSVYTGGLVWTGCVQDGTVGRRDTENTGKRHTSGAGKTDSRVVSRVVL